MKNLTTAIIFIVSVLISFSASAENNTDMNITDASTGSNTINTTVTTGNSTNHGSPLYYVQKALTNKGEEIKVQGCDPIADHKHSIEKPKYFCILYKVSQLEGETKIMSGERLTKYGTPSYYPLNNIQVGGEGWYTTTSPDYFY